MTAVVGHVDPGAADLRHAVVPRAAARVDECAVIDHTGPAAGTEYLDDVRSRTGWRLGRNRHVGRNRVATRPGVAGGTGARHDEPVTAQAGRARPAGGRLPGRGVALLLAADAAQVWGSG